MYATVIFDIEELSTMLTECEAVVNSHPLTYLSGDSDQIIVLSPFLFLKDLTDDRVPCIYVVVLELNIQVNYLIAILSKIKVVF